MEGGGLFALGKIILITGGARSGKSAYALELGEALPGPRAFVATCPVGDVGDGVGDEEMAERIRKHRESRGEKEWQTIEEPRDLASVFSGGPEFRVFLVDCLSLWVNNLLACQGEQYRALTEDAIAERCAEFLHPCRNHQATTVFVTNEVGMGIVPDNALARHYRDLLGRCNQTVAAAADEVVLLTSGVPLTLRPRTT